MAERWCSTSLRRSSKAGEKEQKRILEEGANARSGKRRCGRPGYVDCQAVWNGSLNKSEKARSTFTSLWFSFLQLSRAHRSVDTVPVSVTFCEIISSTSVLCGGAPQVMTIRCSRSTWAWGAVPLDGLNYDQKKIMEHNAH